MEIITDVVIIGGGISGLSIARQLQQKMSDLKIVVLEKNTYPLPEAAIKVGESTVEMGAHYYSTILGLKEHLEKEQLFKLGLRYFFPSGDNSDITQRFEMGSAQLPAPVPTYQIDRGRFENHLYQLNINNGITILDRSKVQDVEIANTEHEQHTITYFKENKQHKIKTKWLIDASGRFGLLKRKLNLNETVKHDSCATWFRLQCVVDINSWSDDPKWQFRSPLKQRRLSTNHLMGAGYWFWIIPLASGSTSFGIVYDPKLHDFENFKDFDTTLQWLNKYEPQVKKIIEPLKNKLQDFRWLKNYAYSCKQVYSENRWYLTGEAGVFSDPFYSPGNDFIALGNTYITDLIYRDKQNENIAQRLKQYNNTYLEYFELLLSHFEGHYQNYGNPYLMLQKILWDTICAFGIPYLIFFKEKFCDLEFMSTIGNEAISTYKKLTFKVQRHFIESANAYKQVHLEKNYLNFSDLIHSKYYGGRIYKQLFRKFDEQALIREIKSNLALMQKLADDILSNKSIIPEFYISGEGNKDELWRVTKSQLTLASQNKWRIKKESIA
jgi:flavin-dependent dehydrogenase